MKELVQFIASSLVEDKSAIFVEETQDDDQISIKLRVAESDMGKVIGKQGRIAKAIRTVVKAASTKKVFVEILGADE